MGKIRVKTLGVEELEEKQKKEARLAREARQAKKNSEKQWLQEKPVTTEDTDLSTENIETKKAENTEKSVKSVVTKKQKAKPARKRSSRYQTAKVQVEPKKYSLSEAVELLKKLKTAKFDETVELHVNTTESGISGNISLPHGTGKKTKVAVADDKIIAEIEKGKINFDILVATPEMMPKLAKVAKVLGPRGLMPNPKTGTITQKPEEVVKKYEGGQISFKTESKTPIIHLTVGKLSFGNKKLLENIKVALLAIQARRITKATLKSTMSPGIKIETVSI